MKGNILNGGELGRKNPFTVFIIVLCILRQGKHLIQAKEDDSNTSPSKELVANRSVLKAMSCTE